MIGRKVYRFETLTSTNDYIKQNLSDLEDGDIVIAKAQTKGRGRRGNSWLSQPGNLYFSFVLKNNHDYQRLFDIVMKISVAIVRLFNDYGLIAKIKYPNDILIENKKISGILIETVGEKEIECLISGIGINVNQRDFSKINDIATSLAIEKNRDYDVKSVLKEFISIYNEAKDQEEIYRGYIENSCIINKNLVYHGIEYKVVDISREGKLKLLSEAKEIDIEIHEIFDDYHC